MNAIFSGHHSVGQAVGRGAGRAFAESMKKSKWMDLLLTIGLWSWHWFEVG